VFSIVLPLEDNYFRTVILTQYSTKTHVTRGPTQTDPSTKMYKIIYSFYSPNIGSKNIKNK